MAEWIKVEKITVDKKEVLLMAQRLEIDPDAVVGKLIRIWSWFDSNSTDGHAPLVTTVMFDRITDTYGFSQAMIDTGWLVQDGDEIIAPNYERHLSQNAKRRAQDAYRQAKSRATRHNHVTLERDNQCDKIVTR